MNYCTNEKCPAFNCARRMILKSEAPGTSCFKFETYEDDGTFDLITVIDGKQRGFSCEGWLYGVIA